jgi:DNA-directed RNA polymerase subunit K/omega
MNSELVKQALEKVGNAYVLINIISQRVRQLGYNSGAISRPLVVETANLGLADIALREVIEEKIGWEVPEFVALTRPVSKKRHPHHAGLKSGSLGNRATFDPTPRGRS